MKKVYTLWALIIAFSSIKAQSWSALDSGVGVDGQINAITVYNNNLYACGAFDTAGNIAANNIATWNGSQWDTVGYGITSHNNYGIVAALGVYNNELYATGMFDSVEGMPASNIAKWNGVSWTILNPGMTGEGLAMAVYNNELYVGGDFSSIGGVTASSIARWNGTNWAAVDSGVYGGISCMTVYDNKLIIGGNFTVTGSTGIVNIAAWDGTSWSAFDNGIGDTSNSAVYALTTNGTNLYAGGDFSQAGNVFTQNVAEWNGTFWSALGAGVGNNSDTDYVTSLAIYNGNLIAGGYFSVNGLGQPVNSIAQWNGIGWEAMGVGVNDQPDGYGYVLTMCDWNGGLYAGGAFITAGILSAGSIAEWSASNGIHEITDGMPSVYPNPAGNQLVIENIATDMPVIVTDLLGQAVIKTVATSSKEIIDVSQLNDGMYFVNGAKFIKQ